MIFATLGTHGAPMDALVNELDRLVEAGAIEDDVVIQAAAFGTLPRHARALGLVTHGELLELIQRADVVVTHAGPGTLAEVRRLGRVPVVVPRTKLRGEHVDDHQVRYAEHLRSQIGYLVVTDLARLAEAIAAALGRGHHSEPADVSRAVAVLDGLMETGASKN